MSIVFDSNGIRIFHGDALETLRTLPDASVNCCVTSPPYWGLRNYGTAEWEGGDEECDHLAPKAGGTGPASRLQVEVKRKDFESGGQYRNTCKKCGATRIDRQLGLERTPDEYVAKMVEVFREVRRVLRDDGTLWLNMGDSYASDSKGTGGPSEKQLSNHGSRYEARRLDHGLKVKDLVGIPWMLAFALRSDGWYLRQDIIWSKPNPMPESVQDRCTKAHEYIFLLSKSERYYYDADAIAEDAVEGCDLGLLRGKGANGEHTQIAWHAPSIRARQDQGVDSRTAGDGKRNKRSVWEVATQPFPEAHFATFSEELIKPCILAGCPIGGTVLDPFGGAMTTMKVARDLNCKGIAIELNADYIEIGKRRLKQSVFDFEGESR